MIQRKKVAKKNKRTLNKPNEYAKGGFRKGWNQLVELDRANYTNNAQKFQEMIASVLNIPLATVNRYINTLLDYPNNKIQLTVIQIVERAFSKFGITENIWENEQHVNKVKKMITF